MATTRVPLSPLAAEFPSSAFASLLKVNDRMVLAFDASTAETAYWVFPWPQGATGTVTFYGQYFMASATSGKVDFEVAIEAITAGDSLDMDTSNSFDTANTITAPTVPGTAGYPGEFTCTLTNKDSVAAGDYVRLSLKRDATDGTNDTATGDCYVSMGEIREA